MNFGWVIAKDLDIKAETGYDQIAYYKGFGEWDDRIDMAEGFDTEDEAINICWQYNYDII